MQGECFYFYTSFGFSVLSLFLSLLSSSFSCFFFSRTTLIVSLFFPRPCPSLRPPRPPVFVSLGITVSFFTRMFSLIRFAPSFHRVSSGVGWKE